VSSPNSVTVSQISDVTTVEVVTQGAQGATFSSSNTTMVDDNKVDGSLVRFSSSNGTFIADSTVTVTNIVDGGNF
jgi:hypothetical protein|tara:strand:+ start:1508 stop:1732 length:225 start_codon:yes stop_codon:yes gene_type:complete